MKCEEMKRKDAKGKKNSEERKIIFGHEVPSGRPLIHCSICQLVPAVRTFINIIFT